MTTTVPTPTVCGYTEAQIIAAANYLPPGTEVRLLIHEPLVRPCEVGQVLRRAEDPDTFLVEFPSRLGTCPIRLSLTRAQFDIL